MKFYLRILLLFGLFMAGAAGFPHLAAWLKKRDIEGAAKARIEAGVKAPSTIRWNAKSMVPKGRTIVLTYDVTADKIEGGMTREVWTFEFDSDTKDLLTVKQDAAPRLQLNSLEPGN